jgi:hypothetical protein
MAALAGTKGGSLPSRSHLTSTSLRSRGPQATPQAAVELRESGGVAALQGDSAQPSNSAHNGQRTSPFWSQRCPTLTWLCQASCSPRSVRAPWPTRKNPFLPKDAEVTGWIYDTTTGRLRGWSGPRIRWPDGSL